MGVELRPLRSSDLEAWAALLAACEKVDKTGEHYDVDDLAEEFADPIRDAERDFIGAWDGDALVGAATLHVRDEADEVHRVHLEGWTHPDHRGRGIGTALLARSFDTARAAHEAIFPDLPVEVESRALANDPEQCSLLTGAGMSPSRWFFTMEADLADLPEPGPLPDQLRLVQYADVDSQQVREAHNAAFAEHWGFAPWSAEMWTQLVDETRAFRPDCSRLLVTDSGQIAAYVVVYEYEAETAATGRRSAYVGKVGVLPDWRRRGIAGTLLCRVLHDCRDGGYPFAALDVDADNATGALGVYERLGFATTTQWIAHTITF